MKLWELICWMVIMSKINIGLVGFFGWGNFGDELFINAHKEHLGQDYDFEVVHDLTKQPYFSKERIKRLKRYDAFLIGGGDLVNPNAVSELYWRKEYLEKPVFIHGIGCPTVSVKSSLSLNYFREYFKSESIRHISLRDIESKNYFDNVIQPALETVSYPDPVCALSLPKKVEGGEKILGVILRSHRSLVGSYGQVRAAVDEAKKLGYKVKIIVASLGELGCAELGISHKFSQNDEEVFSSESLSEVCQEISKCSLILSMKFHGLVVGSMYGIPVIQLSSTQKNKNFFRYIQRPDLQGNYQSDILWRMIPPTPAPIHSLIRSKLRRDSKAGYALLKERIDEVFS